VTTAALSAWQQDIRVNDRERRFVETKREREREREMHREMDREREREQVKWGRKKRGLLLIANYPARQLHTII